MKYEKAMVKVIRLGTEDIITTSGEEHHCGCQGWPSWGGNYTANNNWSGFTYKPQMNWFQKFIGFFWRL